MLRRFFLVCLLAAFVPVGWLYWFARHPHPLPTVPMEVEIHQGASMRVVAADFRQHGLISESASFSLLARVFGMDAKIKTGTYEFDQPRITPLELLAKITKGDVTMSDVTFIEGQTFALMRQALDQQPDIKHLTTSMTEGQILAEISASESAAEGLFFPDTYYFSKGMTDVSILKRAYRLMRDRVAEEWARRDTSLPYADAYQALIMASIIEKETGRKDERSQVSAVFVNRLRKGMKLQTDPTVIYGMGPRYSGALHRKDLQTDTAYNTYTRFGLPPTPIAMPSLASIRAALKPNDTTALYFVARGDGSHEFSDSLEQHNRAVNKFQR
jgi:UPF0755 protein